MQQPGFLDDLRRMSARVGANILLVQGAGGNSSVKHDDVLWVKASGAWLSEAEEKAMFVPVELAGARAALDASGLGSNVRIETADVFAWQSERRFDAICVTGAVDQLPTQFLQWLRPEGRLFVVRGHDPVMEAVLVRADVNGPRVESLFETDLAYLKGAAPTPQFKF